MNNIAIKVTNLTKIYKLYDKPIDRLKESLHPLKKNYHKDFYALNDVNFEIKKGETVGIVGKNGAGKSTLLKIITGVLSQSTGDVHVNGRIASLLELGAGFNPEYTGIENIYLQGTLMGYSHNEMESKIDDILVFADIGDFIHQPVKMYSSGMFARLAFAVAINVEPDILIVDEALSVGDVVFQVKCMAKMKNMMEKGVTVLFVSHDTHSIKTLCNKAIWIENGLLKDYGEAGKVTNKYIESQHLKMNNSLDINDYIKSENVHFTNLNDYEMPIIVKTEPRNIDLNISQRYGNGEAKILDAIVLNEKFELVGEIVSKKDYFIQISILFNSDLPTFVMGAILSSLDGVQQIGCINSQDQVHFPPVVKNNIYVITIKSNCSLKAGIYSLTLSCEFPMINNINHQFLDVINNFLPIKVVYENDENMFYTMFYTKGQYFVKRINN